MPAVEAPKDDEPIDEAARHGVSDYADDSAGMGMGLVPYGLGRESPRGSYVPELPVERISGICVATES